MQNKDSSDQKNQSSRKQRTPVGSGRAAEQKAAVMAALLAGQHTASRIAEMHGVTRATVSKWRKELAAKMPELTQSGTNFAEKIAACLASELEAIQARNKLFADPDWLRQQEADALAVLHGISYDKVIRLVEAAQMARAKNELDECYRN